MHNEKAAENSKQNLNRTNFKHFKPSRLCSKENLNPETLRNCHSQPTPSVGNQSAASRFRMEVQKQLPKKPHTYVTTSKELRNSGEISLNFLSNLTYTIRQARKDAAIPECSDAHKELPLLPATSIAATPRSLCISVQSLPNLKGDCFLCTSHIEELNNDMNTDLLKQIINCNQKIMLNPVARQRRRERLESEQRKKKSNLSNLTKSAPASVEMFPDV